MNFLKNLTKIILIPFLSLGFASNLASTGLNTNFNTDINSNHNFNKTPLQSSSVSVNNANEISDPIASHKNTDPQTPSRTYQTASKKSFYSPSTNSISFPSFKISEYKTIKTYTDQDIYKFHNIFTFKTWEYDGKVEVNLCYFNNLTDFQNMEINCQTYIFHRTSFDNTRISGFFDNPVKNYPDVSGITFYWVHNVFTKDTLHMTIHDDSYNLYPKSDLLKYNLSDNKYLEVFLMKQEIITKVAGIFIISLPSDEKIKNEFQQTHNFLPRLLQQKLWSIDYFLLDSNTIFITSFKEGPVRNYFSRDKYSGTSLEIYDKFLGQDPQKFEHDSKIAYHIKNAWDRPQPFGTGGADGLYSYALTGRMFTDFTSSTLINDSWIKEQSKNQKNKGKDVITLDIFPEFIVQKKYTFFSWRIMFTITIPNPFKKIQSKNSHSEWVWYPLSHFSWYNPLYWVINFHLFHWEGKTGYYRLINYPEEEDENLDVDLSSYINNKIKNLPFFKKDRSSVPNLPPSALFWKHNHRKGDPLEYYHPDKDIILPSFRFRLKFSLSMNHDYVDIDLYLGFLKYWHTTNYLSDTQPDNFGVSNSLKYYTSLVDTIKPGSLTAEIIVSNHPDEGLKIISPSMSSFHHPIFSHLFCLWSSCKNKIVEQQTTYDSSFVLNPINYTPVFSDNEIFNFYFKHNQSPIFSFDYSYEDKNHNKKKIKNLI